MSLETLEYIHDWLRPVVPLLEDRSVTEIMVNDGGMRVFFVRDGLIREAEHVSIPRGMLVNAITQIASDAGRTIDQYQPNLRARFEDGSRVSASLISGGGETLNIRKFPRRYSLEELTEDGSIPQIFCRRIMDSIQNYENIVVYGAPDSGKSTILMGIVDTFPITDRIVLIEDTSEITLSAEANLEAAERPNLVRFQQREGRPGEPEITMGDWVKHAMRYSPTRLIVGEMLGGEAFHFLQAINAGLRGSVSTLHANLGQSIRKLTHLALLANTGLPAEAITESAMNSIDLLVYCEKGRDGRRRVEAADNIDHKV